MKLSNAETGHLIEFHQTRPDWHLAVLPERFFDEDIGGREHKYARAHPYVTGMHYVMRILSHRAPCKVLDIGSPLQQNVALGCIPGIDLTVMDVRPSEDADALGLKWVKGTATGIPYPDGTWPYVTSLWVMGHVGDGRYGDPFCVDGDRKMLAEIARVLAPGGTAIIGPGLIGAECGNIFNLHRIYTWEWLCGEFERAGLKLVEKRDLHVADEVYVERAGQGFVAKRRDGIYGLALLRKT